MSTGNLLYAVLGLVALRPDGAHGYRLKQELESLCDDFWQINYGRPYRILDISVAPRRFSPNRSRPVARGA